jgi:hypothetical protein
MGQPWAPAWLVPGCEQRLHTGLLGAAVLQRAACAHVGTSPCSHTAPQRWQRRNRRAQRDPPDRLASASTTAGLSPGRPTSSGSAQPTMENGTLAFGGGGLGGTRVYGKWCSVRLGWPLLSYRMCRGTASWHYEDRLQGASWPQTAGPGWQVSFSCTVWRCCSDAASRVPLHTCPAAVSAATACATPPPASGKSSGRSAQLLAWGADGLRPGAAAGR